MSASTIPAARSWLVTNLAADPALAGVSVERPGVGNATPVLEQIEVRNARDITREPRSMDGKLTETYTIPVWVQVVQHGQDVEEAETRLWTLVAAVERIANQSNIGGLCISAGPAGATDEESGPGENARVIARVTVLIGCAAIFNPGA